MNPLPPMPGTPEPSHWIGTAYVVVVLVLLAIIVLIDDGRRKASARRAAIAQAAREAARWSILLGVGSADSMEAVEHATTHTPQAADRSKVSAVSKVTLP